MEKAKSWKCMNRESLKEISIRKFMVAASITVIIVTALYNFNCKEFFKTYTATSYYYSNSSDDPFTELDAKLFKTFDVRESTDNFLMENELYKKYLDSKENNQDTVGWVRVGSTIIDYPVMHSKERDYYLTRNSNKQEDINGAIYLDYSQAGRWSSINIIHGHNMKSGAMFGQLIKYKTAEFAKDNPIIEIVMENEIVSYQVFSVFIADAASEVFPLGFGRAEDYESYFNELHNRSMHKLDYSGAAKQIIMLNTCSYEFSNAHLIVCAERK